MIFGDCPYCGNMGSFPVPDGVELPVMVKATCNVCGEWFWEHISRVDPRAFRRDQVEVDEVNKRVNVIVEVGDEVDELVRDHLRTPDRETDEEFTNRILYGTKTPTPEQLAETAALTNSVKSVLIERGIDPFNVRKTDDAALPEGSQGGRPADAGGEGIQQ